MCMLKGPLKRPLVDEPRAFMTDRATATEILVLDIDGNLYEIPNLNYILSVNILSGLGVNTRTLTLSEVISDSGACRIDLAGLKTRLLLKQCK